MGHQGQSAAHLGPKRKHGNPGNTEGLTVPLPEDSLYFITGVGRQSNSQPLGLGDNPNVHPSLGSWPQWGPAPAPHL